MDFATPEPILSAMRRRLERRILGYTTEDDAYRACVARWMKARHGWDANEDEIVISSGIVTALHVAVDRLTQAGDAVLMTTPAYHPFDDAIKRRNRTPLYSRMIDTGGYWTIDFDDFEQKARRADCKLFFLCNPQNPTGRVYSEAELRRMGDICFANDVFVISDEIHEDLTRIGQRHIPFASLYPCERRIITCTSPSKTFNVAGNRHSNLFIADPRIREDWRKNCYCGHAGALSIAANIAAYDECGAWLDELRAYLDESFAMMKSFLGAELPQAGFAVPEGTYLGWVDLTRLGMRQAELNERVSRGGVFVQFGGDFVDNGDCFMRVNIACPRSMLQEGLSRICRSLKA